MLPRLIWGAEHANDAFMTQFAIENFAFDPILVKKHHQQVSVIRDRSWRKGMVQVATRKTWAKYMRQILNGKAYDVIVYHRLQTFGGIG